ncbi:DUF5017 domain-containing protein [Pedobacter sp. MC2016-14]|uniref:DUF5017 domain-containing protein n=1 Tax=Pedobacter sp. MC2016-14 TaxID=2897327 RepID=UPI001E318AC0|nr:DUF5017 domain-containing protein [Pedobacter sp. MC2016-14]MCD0486974.1 DUF5017 domain-containing protein [Pedobacter sp. MC2016-14]
MKPLIFIISINLILLAACSKDKIQQPEFEVQTTALTYKKGEEITFKFSGNPDNITFYSGEAGKDYTYRNRTSLPGKLQIQFSSLVDRGVRNNLSLMVTNDISGTINSGIVETVKWTDVSSRAVFSTGADNTPSGVVDLSDFSDQGKPVTVAFKYTDVKSTVQQNRWVIRTFSASSVRNGQATPLAVMADAGWVGISFKNPAITWTITTAQLLMYGGAVGLDDNEDWVISKQLDPNFIKSDIGYVLKDISTRPSDFSYSYAAAGVYKVTFLASNRIGTEYKEVVKEIVLTIVP